MFKIYDVKKIKLSILLILLSFLIFRCADENKEKKKNEKEKIQIKDSIINKNNDAEKKEIVYDTIENNVEDKIYYDTIYSKDKKYAVLIESYSFSEHSFCLIQTKKKKTDTLITKTKTGCYFDTIFFRDYNFDGIVDFDFVTVPCCRSGANTIHHIYINNGNKFEKLKFEEDGNIFPIKEEKTIYGGYNGVWDFSVYKAKWRKGKLIKTEEHYYADNDGVMIKEDRYFDNSGKIRKTVTDTIDVPPDWSEYYDIMKRD